MLPKSWVSYIDCMHKINTIKQHDDSAKLFSLRAKQINWVVSPFILQYIRLWEKIQTFNWYVLPRFSISNVWISYNAISAVIRGASETVVYVYSRTKARLCHKLSSHNVLMSTAFHVDSHTTHTQIAVYGLLRQLNAQHEATMSVSIMTSQLDLSLGEYLWCATYAVSH